MTQHLRDEVESVRPAKDLVDPWSANAAWVEREPDGCGNTVDVLTILLACSECPWRCAMCDLWKKTLTHPTPIGAIPSQIRKVLSEHGTSARWIKLYNSGSFFDRQSIPQKDYREIARLCQPFQRIIVENHPRLSTRRIVDFQSHLQGQLEIAVGVESLQTGLLRRLNKGMNRDDIDRAIKLHQSLGVDSRAFVLIRPPYCQEVEAVGWSLLTLKHLYLLGVRHVSLIPTRAGNGWMEGRQRLGEFEPPSRVSIEHLFDAALQLPNRGVVTIDLWDWPPPNTCGECQNARRQRLARMNFSQQFEPSITCGACDE